MPRSTLEQRVDSCKLWLQAQLPEALEWLRRMVDINSFTANAEGVNLLGALTAECFEEVGFKPEFVPSEIPAYGRHLFLSRQGKRNHVSDILGEWVIACLYRGRMRGSEMRRNTAVNSCDAITRERKL